MELFNKLSFVREDIKEFSESMGKPSGGISGFLGRVSYALSLAFKEKEIFIFAR